MKDLSISGLDVIGLAKERVNGVTVQGGVNKSEDRVYLPHKKEACTEPLAAVLSCFNAFGMRRIVLPFPIIEV